MPPPSATPTTPVDGSFPAGTNSPRPAAAPLTSAQVAPAPTRHAPSGVRSRARNSRMSTTSPVVAQLPPAR